MKSHELLQALKPELEVADLFRRLGYFTRAHIDLYPSDTFSKVSDIDVFGIRFDAQLTPSRIVAEVKKNECGTTNILKLHGLGSYLGRCDCYFITGGGSTHCRRVARELDIRVASREKIISVVGKAPSGFIASNPKSIATTFSHLEVLKKKIDRDLYWRYFYLWLEKDPYQRLYHQQDLFESALEHLESDETQAAAKWFRRELFLLSQISIMEVASDCVGVPDTIIKSYIEGRFMNLGTPRKSKEKIKSGVEKLLSIIDELSGNKIEFPEIEILPRYLPTLTKLIQFVLTSARFAQQYLLRNNELNLLMLDGKDIDISKMVSPEQIKYIREFNDLLGRVMHNGPIKDDFRNFL